MRCTSSRMLLIKLISPKILLKISKMVNFELSFFKISFTSFFLYVPLARNIFYLIRKIMQLDLSINKTVFFLICSSSLVSCCNRQLQMMVSSLTLRDYTLYCNVENTNFTLYQNISRYIINQVPVGNYIFKVNNKNTRARCEICSKFPIKTPERRHWRRFGVFIVNFEYISHLAQCFCY